MAPRLALLIALTVLLACSSVGQSQSNEKDNSIPIIAENLSGPLLTDYVNKVQHLFTEQDVDDKQFENMLMDSKYLEEPPEIGRFRRASGYDNDNTPIPDRFDAREQWPYCTSIGKPRNQRNCRSCWAVATAAVMTDRICIASNGTKKYEISAANVLTCGRCGSCRGGYPSEAFRVFAERGFVTGGEKLEDGGCQPYSFIKKDCPVHPVLHIPMCTKEHIESTPKCEHQCTNKNYNISYESDFIKGKRLIRLPPRNVRAMQLEIMKRGPVTVTFATYLDFLGYKGGIYKHVAAKNNGAHAAKLIGWGSEGGVDYWIGVNSWGPKWGENGLFRFIRGIDECGIESHVDAVEV